MNALRKFSLGLAVVVAALLATGYSLRAAESVARPIIEIVKDAEPAYIVLAKTEHKGVLAAAKDLQRDITKITGVTPNIVNSLNETWGKCIVLGSADCPEGKALLASVGVGVEDLAGKWEIYKWRVLTNAGGKEQVLAIGGSNVRGTIFGIYEFEHQHLGVDPLWFWADHEPPTKGELVFDDRVNFGPSQEPTWKYRGWSLNDHPIFMEWMQTGLVQRARYGRYMFAIHPEVLDRLWEAALRLRMNMFTWYFIDIDWQPDRERLQAEVDRGLFVTQHQMEGVGADTGYWDNYWKHHHPAGRPADFSYLKHPEAFREFWTYYIKRWAEFSPQVVWEINLRGWADGNYSEPTLPNGGTEQQLAQIISDALADEARLVRKFDPNPDLEMMTTLYSEQGHAYDQGWLKIPAEVTTGFSDAGMSGMSYSKKFWTEPRDPKRKYGQYFHTQYFGGGPQIAKCTPIETYIKVNMDAMFQRGDTQHMLLAMNHLRHQQLEIRGIAEMLWNYRGFQAREYLTNYCREEFGPKVAPQVAALYDAYYEKHPHTMKNDGNKTYAVYQKVMEPMFTIIGNLLYIDEGVRDGFALSYQYKREIYEAGIKDLGEVLAQARALRSSIPKDRQGFFDYEFTDAIRLVRGLYKLSIATQEAIAKLKTGDRAGALAILREAQPLTEELNAAFRDERSGEKWQHWFRSGTNQDFYTLYNLFQKARLRLEIDGMAPVAVTEPPRHPYYGNVVTHDPARAGDAVYGTQAERIDGSFQNGSRYSLTDFPLEHAFQIGGVRSVYTKWKGGTPGYVPDYGLGYRFTLAGRARVYVAKEKGAKLAWLFEDGFKSAKQMLHVGEWDWPYRYQNRPPSETHDFDLFVKDFPAGEVVLGKNDTSTRRLPYIVFIQPALLAWENFRQDAFGAPPSRWTTSATRGSATIIDVPEYDGEMRPSVFDLSTVPRYVPLDLRALKLHGAAASELAFTQPAKAEFVFDARLKAGQNDQRVALALGQAQGAPAIEIAFGADGKITANGAPIADYQPDRWYNLKLRVRVDQGQFDVEVQDDAVQVKTAPKLAFAPGAPKTLDRVRLTTTGDRHTWLLCNALSAYER